MLYQSAKNLLKSAIPKKWMLRFETPLRALGYLPYAGSSFSCNICNAGLRAFVHMPDGQQLCPRCGSLSRTRRLWHLLHTKYLQPGDRIIEFSPPRCVYRRMKAQRVYPYTSTDLSDDFLADLRLDITSMPEVADGAYDVLLCYHILEHVDDDRAAMREMYRILRPGGMAFVQTPFKTGETYEDPTITSPEERLIHFGQADHVRYYSLYDLRERLTRAGFNVEHLDFDAPDTTLHGLKQGESVLLCLKPEISG